MSVGSQVIVYSQNEAADRAVFRAALKLPRVAAGSDGKASASEVGASSRW